MKVAALALLVLLTGCMSTSEPYYVRDSGQRVYGYSAPVQGNELVCHKGKKTMSLPASAVDAHLGHGDHRGPC
jgi:hypothetical protein